MTGYTTMNDDTTNAFRKFSKSISICIINRLLGIISVLFIIASFLFLAVCFWLLTGSKYIENTMIELCKDVDFSEFKNMVDEYISSISNTVNSYLGYPFIPKTEIKHEFKTSLKNHIDNNREDHSISSDSDSDSDIEDVTEEMKKEKFCEVIDFTISCDSDDDNSNDDNSNDNSNDKNNSLETEKSQEKTYSVDSDNYEILPEAQQTND